jgi:hypothetical protein
MQTFGMASKPQDEWAHSSNSCPKLPLLSPLTTSIAMALPSAIRVYKRVRWYLATIPALRYCWCSQTQLLPKAHACQGTRS